jgi:fluoride exporter
METLAVFVGGGVGSLLRHGTGRLASALFGPMSAASGWPFGTLAVNVAGCFAMGLAYRLLAASSPEWRFLLMTGVLGGFTTYSAFALDSAHLWMRADFGPLSLYLAGTLAGSLGGVALGLAVGKVLAS